jgi:hypothetical protein
MEILKTICCLKNKELERFLFYFLKDCGYKNIDYLEEQYIIAEGELPICLIAHLDTVFMSPPNEDDFLYDSEKKILWTPHGTGFDDRAGVAAILEILNAKYRPSIIFTQGEEDFGIGATSLICKYKQSPFNKCNALIELDRKGEKDCVFYQCDNQEFIKYIEKFGYEKSIGSFSDISIIAPKWRIAAVNLSIGYLEEHTIAERLNIEWYQNSISRLYKILDNSKHMKFYKYIKAPKNNFIYDYLEYDNVCFFCNNHLEKYKYKIVTENGLKIKCCNNCYKEFYTNHLPFS